MLVEREAFGVYQFANANDSFEQFKCFLRVNHLLKQGKVLLLHFLLAQPNNVLLVLLGKHAISSFLFLLRTTLLFLSVLHLAQGGEQLAPVFPADADDELVALVGGGERVLVGVEVQCPQHVIGQFAISIRLAYCRNDL